MTLNDAIAMVGDDLRAEDPDRPWTDSEAIESTRDGVSLADIDNLVDGDLMDEETAEAYRIVLTATDDQIELALGE
jgi:hypothetical protein